VDEAEERGWLPLSPAPLSPLGSSVASLRTIALDDSEHLLHNHHASVASLRLLFTFTPECRSESLRNSVHLHRNTQRNGARKSILTDLRDLLFPPDPTNHAPPRELVPGASLEDRRSFMQSCFRLGVPLTEGYHHDVQYLERGLAGERFECSRNGSVHLTCAYANVYPDDFVREGN
jgi:hypothetical protein